MRSFFQLLLGLLILGSALAQTAYAQDAAVYLVTYVDVLPNATESGAALLERYRDLSRKDYGNLRFDTMREISRPNRFAIFEAWKDRPALDAHAKAEGTRQFRDKLKTIADAPYDERVNNGLFVGSKRESRPDAIYVLTHVDVIPSNKDDCIAALKAMSTDTPKDAGNIGYDVLQQASRPNHFSVAEAWANRKALDAHAMAAHTRAFREKLSPMAGALYDERFYKLLD